MNLRQFSDQYFDIIHQNFSGLNLTAIQERDQFFFKQILDSLLIYRSKSFVQLRKERVIYDIGFGGGFPILPIAFQERDLQLRGIDARAKKVEAVKKIAQLLGIEVILQHARLENLDLSHTLLLFKAVGKINKMLPLVRGRDIYAFFYKGPNIFLEEQKVEGWNLVEDVHLRLANTNGRRILVYRRN